MREREREREWPHTQGRVYGPLDRTNRERCHVVEVYRFGVLRPGKRNPALSTNRRSDTLLCIPNYIFLKKKTKQQQQIAGSVTADVLTSP